MLANTLAGEGTRQPNAVRRTSLLEHSSKAAFWCAPIHPYSKIRFRWDLLVIVLLAYTCVMLPLGLAEVFLAPVSDTVVNCLFMVDILINCRTGYTSKEMITVLDSRRIMVHYGKTWFVPDLLATIPFDLMLASADGPGVSVTIKFLRCLRFLRLLRLGRVHARLKIQSTIKQSHQLFFSFVCSALLFAHWYACGWYALGAVQWEDDSMITWSERLKGFYEPTNLGIYATSFYWSLTTMSTIGYGDITAANEYERLFSMFVMVTGTAVYAYGITSVIQIYTGVSAHHMRLMQQKDILADYLSRLNVPYELQKTLREYFVHYEDALITFNERNMLSVLSPGLRAQVAALANAPLLRRVPFFEKAEEACIAEIVLELEPHLFIPSELIIHQGHMGKELFIIKSGEVRIFLNRGETNELELARLIAGDFIGEGALLRGSHARRGAYASAVYYSILYSLDADRVDMILENYPDVRKTIADIARQRSEANAAAKTTTARGEQKSRELSDAAPTNGLAKLHGVTVPDGSSENDPRAVFQEWARREGFAEYLPAMKAQGYETMTALHGLTAASVEELIQAAHIVKPGHTGVLRAIVRNKKLLTPQLVTWTSPGANGGTAGGSMAGEHGSCEA